MAFMLLPASDSRFHLAPVERRHAVLFCFVLLTASCGLASFALACATPFAAFAVVAAALLPRRSALLVVIGSWLVNQTIGFGVLRYPINESTIAWGFVIGGAALAATIASSAVFSAFSAGRAPFVFGFALVCAYGAYELLLFAATPFLGGGGAFHMAIVARIGLLNIAWMIGLIITCEFVRLGTLFRRSHTTF